MRKLFIILLTFFIFLTFYIIFIDNITFYNSLLDTLNLWLYKVLPSLFVFNILEFKKTKDLILTVSSKKTHLS